MLERTPACNTFLGPFLVSCPDSYRDQVMGQTVESLPSMRGVCVEVLTPGSRTRSRHCTHSKGLEHGALPVYTSV